MVVAENNLAGFTKFVEDVFGATVSVRNKGQNILVSMSSGIIVGTLNGKFYTFNGPQELIKTVLGMWNQGLAFLEEQLKVQALAQNEQVTEVKEDEHVV